MEQHKDLMHSSEIEYWNVFGCRICKNEVVYFSQTIILYSVIIIALVNISLGNEQSQIWVGLLSGSLGYLLPNPTINQKTITIHHYNNQCI